MEQNIEVPAIWENIPRLIDFVDSVTSVMALSDTQDYVMRLVIEEIATNIIKYGYGEDNQGIIQLRCTLNDGSLQIIIRDQGRPFDPRECIEPDLCNDVQGRTIGGLGLFLVREFSDYLSYHHDATSGWNELLVVKGQ
jgi:anti-sigma regulatory factor (Ser/Thr protein kinase)